MAVSPTWDAGPTESRQPLVLERCVLSVWRGYVKASFVACLDDGTLVAESASFKCRGGEPAGEGAAKAAHAQLLSTLNALGWARTAGGEPWYAAEYGRWVEAPAAVDRPEGAPQAAEEPAPPPTPAPRVVPAPAAAAQVQLLPEPEAAASGPAAPMSRRRRRLPLVTLVSVAGVASAVGAGLFIAKDSRFTAHVRTVVVTTTAPARVAVAPRRKPVAPTPRQVGPRPRLHVVITAKDRPSWLEIRRGSATGALLFSGELAPGRTLRYSGRRLWARFGSAGNVVIMANGRRVPLVGTYEHVFRAAR